MITNKDIRVENGSLIINGDPYPLDGQSPEAIMQIVEDNSDTTPTENSDAPITSGGVYTALAGLIKYKDVTVKSDSTGHVAPVQSAGGAYYEPIVSFAALNITRDKVLNIIPVGWTAITKPFTLYMSVDGSHVGALSDSSASIYKDNTASLALRIVYKG